LATYTATRYAAEKARRGGGPTFMEFLTYRVSAHSSSDDPSRYRDESVTETWRKDRDPIDRMRTFMRRRGWLADSDHDRMATEIETEVRTVVSQQEQVGPPPIESLIEDVYEIPTWLQREQFRELKGG